MVFYQHIMIGFLHIRTTRRLLADFGFSSSARQIASQAAVWPDAVRYFDDRFHAQTSLQKNGRPQPGYEASVNFTQLLRNMIKNIHTNDPIERLAWLGCCLHLVQDLAVHQGNTGPEHFWQLFWLWKFPDISSANVRRANDFSRNFIVAIRIKYGEVFWNDLVNTSVPQTNMRQLRENLLGTNDFSWPGVFRFIRSIWQYLWWPGPLKRLRWDISTILQKAVQ